MKTIRTPLNGVSANIDSDSTIRDVLQANISRSVTKKVSEAKKTGAAATGKLTQLDETVLDILGRESSNIQPVKVEDSETALGGAVAVTKTFSQEGNFTICLVCVT